MAPASRHSAVLPVNFPGNPRDQHGRRGAGDAQRGSWCVCGFVLFLGWRWPDHSCLASASPPLSPGLAADTVSPGLRRWKSSVTQHSVLQFLLVSSERGRGGRPAWGLCFLPGGRGCWNTALARLHSASSPMAGLSRMLYRSQKSWCVAQEILRGIIAAQLVTPHAVLNGDI